MGASPTFPSVRFLAPASCTARAARYHPPTKFMHHALRSSLAIVAIAACAGCQTHDRRMYSIHREKNLHTPDPWAPSTTKAAEDATASLGLGPGDSAALPAPPMETGNQ